MTFDDFEQAAHAAFEAIPSEYREGIDALVVEKAAEAHPHLPEIWTLGHCDTESYPSDFESAETVRSTIRLFWGSFRQLAEQDDDFDWIAEIHETVEHEVKHHLEWLAGEDALGDVDAVLEQDFRRSGGGPGDAEAGSVETGDVEPGGVGTGDVQMGDGQRGDVQGGLEWDPQYYRWGEEISPGVFAAEDLIFIEIMLSATDLRLRDGIDFALQGRWFTIPAPEEFGDIHFIRVDGLPMGGARVEVVLVRKRSWIENVKRLFGSGAPRVLESVARGRERG